MDAKLAAYRAKKEKQRQSENSFYNRFKSWLFGNDKLKQNGSKRALDERSQKRNIENQTAKQQNETSVQSNTSNDTDFFDDTTDVAEPTKLEIVTKWILRCCKLALWFCLWGLFIELQFGAVFFTVSAIIFTYINTRTGPRDGKLSAYSVFNKDCERIQGTVTAEQMQKSMFGVPGLKM
ncbi:hypothetical protein EGW08_000826 [Elysia chlorotica]|uniref:SAYSvFN domain-containing protein n=1 Tax=Elysia chlorotica TaxID=188477 RepID=A0A433UC65_ELYCH|nr:hypothetical protein EGW08_000826 [Elysia chlorotica]